MPMKVQTGGSPPAQSAKSTTANALKQPEIQTITQTHPLEEERRAALLTTEEAAWRNMVSLCCFGSRNFRWTLCV